MTYDLSLYIRACSEGLDNLWFLQDLVSLIGDRNSQVCTSLSFYFCAHIQYVNFIITIYMNCFNKLKLKKWLEGILTFWKDLMFSMKKQLWLVLMMYNSKFNQIRLFSKVKVEHLKISFSMVKMRLKIRICNISYIYIMKKL